MKTFSIILLMAGWTVVQAQTTTSSSLNTLGRYNSKDQVYEITYDDLVNELSTKKQKPAESNTPIWGFSKTQALFGYSFSSMNIHSGKKSADFTMSGLDLRLNGQFTDSIWQAEAGFKNYGRATSQGQTAEARALSAMIKTQDVLNANFQYTFGAGPSLNFVNAEKSEMQTSLNIQGGIRSPLSPKLSWGADLGAYSPISNGPLKSGIEMSLLLSATL